MPKEEKKRMAEEKTKMIRLDLWEKYKNNK
jgi:hypothetical protein